MPVDTNFRRYRNPAVVEGKTNEATELTKASSAAAGKILLLPKGTYLVTNTWTLQPGMTIRGEGPDTVIKMQSSQLDAVALAGITFRDLKVINNGVTGASLIFTRCDDLSFENVQFDNTLAGTNPSGTTPIWLKGCDNVKVRGCKFLNCYQGVYCGDDGAGAECGTVSVERCHFEHTLMSEGAFPAQIYQFRGKHVLVDKCTFANIFPGGAATSPRGYCVFEGDGVGESVTTTVRDCRCINSAVTGETGPNVFCQIAQSRRGVVTGNYYDGGGPPGEFFEGGGLDRTTLFDNDIVRSYVLVQPLDGATLCDEVVMLSNRFRLASLGSAAVRVGANGNGFNLLHFGHNTVNGSRGGGLFVNDVRKFAYVLNNEFLDCNQADRAFSAGANEFEVSAIAFYGGNARFGLVSGNRCENTLGGAGHTAFGFACDSPRHSIDVRPDNFMARMDSAPHRNARRK